MQNKTVYKCRKCNQLIEEKKYETKTPICPYCGCIFPQGFKVEEIGDFHYE